MKLYVGVTDNKWFDFLSSRSGLDEVNFWQPSPVPSFKNLQPGELFFFKLHSPRDFIAGGGVFVYSTTLPISLAWDVFKEKNGASTFEEMRELIIKHRGALANSREDFKIGCILLIQPFFFDEFNWFPPPDWSAPIVRGKGYDLGTEAGKFIWKKVNHLLAENQIIDLYEHDKGVAEENYPYGKEILIKPRLGQGVFRVLVTDSYSRCCAITKERALPVLDAAHIKPYSEHGPHEVNNGILLRSDMHKLFDSGYMTITQKLHIEVSRRIKEEFENGKYYFTFHGKPIHPPGRIEDHPSPEFLVWHNENIFRG